MKVVLMRSRALKFFETVRLCTYRPGPTSEYGDALPKWPGDGAANAEASNQCSRVRLPEGRLPLPIRSGRPPTVFVFEGSEPEKLGEKNWPVSAITIQFACHPPSTKSIARGALVRIGF